MEGYRTFPPHWSVMADGKIVGDDFPHGEVLIRLADRNKEVYELRERLRGAVQRAEDAEQELAGWRDRAQHEICVRNLAWLKEHHPDDPRIPRIEASLASRENQQGDTHGHSR